MKSPTQNTHTDTHPEGLIRSSTPSKPSNEPQQRNQSNLTRQPGTSLTQGGPSLPIFPKQVVTYKPVSVFEKIEVLIMVHDAHFLMANRKQTKEEMGTFYPSHIRAVHNPHMWLALCSHLLHSTTPIFALHYQIQDGGVNASPGNKSV